jgi:hypothetical protein
MALLLVINIVIVLFSHIGSTNDESAVKGGLIEMDVVTNVPLVEH